MKILVCPHHMGMGGSQLNAIELAGKVRELGHEVVIYAPDGVLVSMVRDLGIPYAEAPAPGNAKQWRLKLNRLIEEHRIDVVHAYEWGPSLAASFSAGIRNSTPVVASVMSMHVPEFLPRHLPIIVGTPALASELAWQQRTAFLLEPPVDVQANTTVDAAAARRKLGIADGELVVSVVSMLSTELEKLQGILSAIALVDRLAEEHPVRLLIAGDGDGMAQVRERAWEVNKAHGRIVVDALGYLEDPRPAYAAADIVLGMGTSAIKGMAHAKALVVQGEAGYWKTLTEQNAEHFLSNGWFGYEGRGVADLEAALLALFFDPDLRVRLGAFGRSLVESRYSLERSANELAKIYFDLLAHRGSTSAGTRARSLLRSAIEVSRFRTAMKSGAPTEREKWSHSGVEL